MRKSALQSLSRIRRRSYSIALPFGIAADSRLLSRPIAFWETPGAFSCKRRRARNPFAQDTEIKLGHFAARDPRLKLQAENSGSEPRLIEILEQQRRRFLDRHAQLTLKQATFELNAILQLWLDCYKDKSLGTKSDFIPKSMDMWQWMKDMMPQLHPNMASYQALLDGVLATKGHGRNAAFAESLLTPMVELAMKERDDGADTLAAKIASAEFNPSDQSRPSLSSIEAKELLNMTYSFHKVMTLHCQANDVASAERLLRELERLNDISNGSIPLTADSYTIVLSGWTKRGAPREAEYVLNDMMNRAARAKRHDLMPTKNNFESCLKSWVSASNVVSGQRAELLLLKMQELHEKRHDTKPCVKSFSKVVAAWVSSRHQDASVRADAILQMMNEMDWSGETDIASFHKTMADTYLQVMKMWSWSGNPNAPEKCSELLLKLEDIVGFPNIKSVTLQRLYAALISAWARSRRPDIASRVHNIFAELETQRKTGGAFAEVGDFFWDSSVYHAVFQAYSTTGEGEKAETLLKGILKEYLENHTGLGSSSALPMQADTKSFNSVLLAWSKSTDPDAANRAEKLFLQMLQLRSSDHLDIKPDVVSYNAVLSAFSGTNNESRARRGAGYFRQMKSNPSCQPTTVTYTRAILLWSNIRTPEALEQAQTLLDEMNAGDRSIRPDTNTYKAFLLVLKKSGLPEYERTRRIEAIHLIMKKLAGRSAS